MASRTIKTVSGEWVWFTKYGGFKTRFYIAMQPGRSIEIGTGLAPQGYPWGKRKILKQPEVLTVYGFGSVSVRSADLEGLCMVSIFKDIDEDNLPADLGF